MNELLLRERRGLWPTGYAARWEPKRRDVLFLTGMDWSYLAEWGLESLPNPKIHLVQGLLPTHETNRAYRYFAERAIRICVSPEVADAVSATGLTKGPILTIPNGIDVAPAGSGGGGYYDGVSGAAPPDHDHRLQAA